MFAAIVAPQLVGPAPVGLANNGDFSRVLGPFGICLPPAVANDAHLYFRYFVNEYQTGCPLYDERLPNSEAVFVASAKSIAKLTLPAGTFRLSVLGLIHAAVAALALFVLLSVLRDQKVWKQLFAAGLVLFVWTDIRYVEQFNTAYWDTAAHLALLLLFAIAVSWVFDADRPAWPVSFALAGWLLLASKTQHQTVLPVLIGFCWFAAFRVRSVASRALWLTAPLLFATTTLWMLLATPGEYRAPPAFTLVFFKLTTLSPDPRTVLADFNMSEPEFLKYVGLYAYEPQAPMSDPAFQKRMVRLVTPRSLGSFYLRRPQTLRKVLVFDLKNSASDVDLTSSGYGYRREPDVQKGRRPFVLTAWTRFRRRLFALAPFHLVWFFGTVIGLSLVCFTSARVAMWLPLWPVTLLTVLLAIATFLSASLLDAVETARHLTIFQTATDLTIVSLVLSIALSPRWNQYI